MAKVVTFAKLPKQQAAGGAHIAAITTNDTHEMAAGFIHILPGEHWTATVAAGADCYLFVLEGFGILTIDKLRYRLATHSFATIQEGKTYIVENDGSAPANLIRVMAPPQPRADVIGFTGGLAIAERDKTTVINLPKEKKKRIYFAGPYAARTHRGHAMIVVYEKDTVTLEHHHPNAESMFVILDGVLQFTINGESVRVAPGEAVVLNFNDRHAVRCADGHFGASFLEFHVPAVYATVR